MAEPTIRLKLKHAIDGLSGTEITGKGTIYRTGEPTIGSPVLIQIILTHTKHTSLSRG